MKNYTFIITLLLFSSLNSSVLFAADTMARVLKSQNMPGYPAGYTMLVNTAVETGEKQRLALKTTAGDTVIIGENSSFKLVEPGLFSQVFGKIYYFIRSRNEGRQLRVRSTVATLGVRGTKFIISNNDDGSNGQVALAEGLLDVESNDDQPFAITAEREPTEFERYKLESLKKMQGMQDEFENYKKQINLEFTEYKKSFELTANSSLSFSGKNVLKTPLSSEQKDDMQSFEAFIEQVEPN